MADTAIVALASALAAGSMGHFGTWGGEWVSYALRRRERAEVRTEQRRSAAVQMIESTIEQMLGVRAGWHTLAAGVGSRGERSQQILSELNSQPRYLWRPDVIDDSDLRRRVSRAQDFIQRYGD